MNEQIKYELLFIKSPDISEKNEAVIEAAIKDILSKGNAELLKFDRWGKFKLAYPIKHYEYGIYTLLRFSVSGNNKDSILKELKDLFSIKYVDLVLRELLLRLPYNVSDEYKRPESLDEIPSKEDDFIEDDIKDENVKEDIAD
jgi:small subunit ribosomal protein S6